jgi:hypothetical protein
MGRLTRGLLLKLRRTRISLARPRPRKRPQQLELNLWPKRRWAELKAILKTIPGKHLLLNVFKIRGERSMQM